MPLARLKSGQIVETPEGLSKGGTLDWLIQQGVPPEDVGIEPVQPEIGGFGEQFSIGFGEFLSDRVPSLRSEIRAPDTLGVNIGRAFPFAGAAALGAAAAPGLLASGSTAMIGQGLIAAGVEATDPQASPGEIATTGLSAAVGQGAGDIGSRALSGMARRIGARLANLGRSVAQRKVVTTQSPRLRTLAETLGGLGKAKAEQQKILNAAAVEAVGETGDKLTPALRLKAAKRIGEAMDAALPTGPVDVTDAYVTLDEIPGSLFPGKRRILDRLEKAELSPEQYQRVTRELRDMITSMAGRPEAIEVSRALDSLVKAGEAAGAPSTRIVREQYKNLLTLENIASFRRSGGEVSPLAAENALKKAYGIGTLRKTGEGTLPSTRRFIEVTQTLAEEAAAGFRSSGTAERQVQAEAAEAVTGLLTGQGPGRAARSLGTILGAGPVIGAASMGVPVTGAGALGVGLTKALTDEVEREARGAAQ